MTVDYALRRNLDLLYLLIRKDVTLQYKRTALGFFWSLLNPLLLTVVYYIAFTIILNTTIPNFVLFLLSVLFPWTWFSNSISLSNIVLIANKSLIKKILFPRHFLLLSVITSQCIHFLFSLPIIAVLVYYYGNTAGMLWLWGIPVLIIIQFMMTLGFSLIVSTINVYFRDFSFIVAFLLNMLFWMTPILYTLDKIPERYRSIFVYLNPLTILMSSWRDLFMSNMLHWNMLGFAFATALIVLLGGAVIFRQLGKRIDEVI